jgi:primosomal protein N' (replication factor Y)
MIEEDLGSVLFIHPRRGNFRVTQCQQCRYVWYCPDCSAALVTYKNSYKTMELICHHCQNKFDYPNICPECKGSEISSFSSGIEDLEEYLGNTYKDKEIFKIDTSNSKNMEIFKQHLAQNLNTTPYYLTSKLYDPRVPYSSFKSIVFIHAQNLTTGVDYLTTEEIYYSLFSIYLQSQNIVNSSDVNQSKSPTLLIFDTSTPELQLFQKMLLLNTINADYADILELYKTFIIEELDSRKRFHLPPYHNLLLLTQSSKKLDTLKENMSVLHKWLKEATVEMQPELEISTPYPAKMLKRQGLYTFHLLLKYPKNFKHLKELDKILKPKISDMRLQARLNPRHIF